MATIENVNDRTILQQFHSLYKAVDEIKNKGINLNVKGQYESGTTYLKGDVVYNNGKAFYRINDDATTGIDTSNTEYWQMFFDAVTGLQGPQGPQGPQGRTGADGWGFNNATFIDILNDAISVSTNGISLSQTMQVTAEQQVGSNPPSASIFEIETTSNIPIVGSDTIVVDLDEQGEKVEIHIDAEITNKLARTLVTPLSVHRETEIVAVDNTNSQTMLAIGDGLTIENGALKASGGTGATIYRHNILFTGTYRIGPSSGDPTASIDISLIIYNKDSTPLSTNTLLKDYFNTIFTDNSQSYQATGITYTGDTAVVVKTINKFLACTFDAIKIVDGILSVVKNNNNSAISFSGFSDFVTEL